MNAGVVKFFKNKILTRFLEGELIIVIKNLIHKFFRKCLFLLVIVTIKNFTEVIIRFNDFPIAGLLVIFNVCHLARRQV